ncbi:hypothetical protein CONPUDRAFT_150891 [Coniophora puteana RWD-64-598 SS2]|uniref:Uncharacterized protein n=1 Tax=Coniophora puteana (strain RWD-64-598) TaxID=741705 RepID=A0A5M3MXL1_CONPW|nr:uncharacterized protein CONPUDRAFT_150891 [Coniophora puteana RWD-64-598 SS2]EIW83838.1 hypothetical protein CONPUDRAFT_150891 [Coniophora puteana RWD-64-598 SS2]
MSIPNSRSPIVDLPPEVLLMIFKHASQPRTFEKSELEADARGEAVAIVHASCEAENTAHALPFVCRRWHNVAAMESTYWKHLDINIDGSSFIPAIVETFFVASRNSPISVTIVPPLGKSCSLTASQEHSRWQFIMANMSLHLGRLTSLCIETYYRSTSVIISRFLDGATLSLEDFRLTSHETDDTSPLQICSLNLTSSRLYELHIDAGSFVSLMESNIQWPSEGSTDLNLKRYHPISASLALSPAHLMAALQKFGQGRSCRQVAIDEVQFGPDDSPPNGISLPEVSYIELVDIHGPFIPLICNAIRQSSQMESMIVRGCSTPSRSPLLGYELLIRDIDSSVSLLRMVQGSEVAYLDISECDGFDDWFLGALSLRGEADNSVTCPNLSRLEVSDCTFSASALQRMCEMRHEDAPIKYIKVRLGSKLDDDSRSWFESHIEVFDWEERASSNFEAMSALEQLLSRVVDISNLGAGI